MKTLSISTENIYQTISFGPVPVWMLRVSVSVQFVLIPLDPPPTGFLCIEGRPLGWSRGWGSWRTRIDPLLHKVVSRVLILKKAHNHLSSKVCTRIQD